MDSLVTFDVSYNNTGWYLPESIGSASSLTYIDFSTNWFSGTLPSSLGSLKGLEYLYVSTNWSVDTIPRTLAAADSELVQVWMQTNALSGAKNLV
jgi:Leucine-rich repeat (LRR) protein